MFIGVDLKMVIIRTDEVNLIYPDSTLLIKYIERV